MRALIAQSIWLLAIFFWSTGIVTARAHGIEPHASSEFSPWSFEPGIWIGLTLTGWWYARGVRRLWKVKVGRGIERWEAICYAGGWIALVIALASPLHPLGSVLFSAHMTQHEILMLVAAPLLVLGQPLIAFLKALPGNWSHEIVRVSHAGPGNRILHFLANPLAAWVIHAVALWIWHLPVLFQATLHNEWIHAFQHLSFLLSALLFWWAVMRGRQRSLGYGAAVLYLFTTALHNGLLGALITFAHSVIYPACTDTTARWGLSPMEDQQLGGLIMWVPAGLAYVFAALCLFAGWLRESESRVRQRETEIANANLLKRTS